MKRLIVLGAIVVSLIGVNVYAEGVSLGDNLDSDKVQKLYITGTSSEFDVGSSVGSWGVDSTDKWGIEGRAKVELYKGFGVDASAYNSLGNSLSDTVLRTGVFYQPADWAEVSYSTTYGVEDLGGFGETSVVRVSVGKGF